MFSMAPCQRNINSQGHAGLESLLRVEKYACLQDTSMAMHTATVMGAMIMVTPMMTRARASTLGVLSSIS